MTIALLVSATVLGLLSFFEPCTIATHTLFAVRANLDTASNRRRALAQLILSRALLLSLLFSFAAAIGLEQLTQKTATLMLGMTGLIYLITRKVYLPVPHLEFFRLLPNHDNLTQSYKLGLSLPACTLPLVAITGILCALNRQPAIAALTGLIFALMFTLPTLWESTHKFSTAHRNFLSHATRLSPYLTTLLLWSSALIILKTGG